MSDESLIRALRALDRPVDVDPGFGDALYAILEGELARRRQFRPRLTLLLVAALIAALLVGGAIAVGSGLLRLPWPNDRSLIQPGAMGCPASLPAGQLFELVVNEDGYADPGDEWGPPAGFVVRVYDDGLLLTAGVGRTRGQIRAGDSGMTARRLSATGVQLVLDAAERGALGSGCHDRWADIPGRALLVRGADGHVVRAAWGQGSGIRRMTDEEQLAAERLVEQLRDPEMWLPAEAWIDAVARPYVPDRWLLDIQLPPTYADPEGALDRRMELPKADEVVLPGGVALLAFGDPYQEPDSAAAPEQPGLRGRCTLVAADFARSLTEAFADAGAVAFNGSWWFRYESDALGVAIRPLLPTDEGCTAFELGLAAPPGPTSSPAPQPSGDLAIVEPCSFFSEASMRTAMQIPATEPVVVNDRWTRDRVGMLGPAYRVCFYRLGGSLDHLWDHPIAAIHVRTSSTDLAEARALAREILGADALENVIADRTVWHNGCALGTSGCKPALAVSVEPYFVVIAWEQVRQELDLPSVARALASAMETAE